MNRPPLLFPSSPPDAHKGHFGRVLLIGGSRGMAGSIALSAIAALRTGSGLVSAAVPDRCLETVAGFHPGVMTVPLSDTSDGQFAIQSGTQVFNYLKRSNAIGIGPGMATGPGSIALVARVLADKSTPRVFDADAINVIAMQRLLNQEQRVGPAVLTPHPGELARLTGVSPSDRGAQIEAAKQLSRHHGMVIVVKGGPSVVVAPGVSKPDCWTNDTGNPAMATAGSGDVLTGMITSLLGQGLEPWDAARLGVWLHGRAGDLAAATHGRAGTTCWEILQAIPSAVPPRASS